MPLHAPTASTATNFNVKATLIFDRDSKKSSNRLMGLWRLMPGYRLRYGAALVFQVIEALMNALSLLLLGFLVDSVLRQPPADLLNMLVLVALGFIGLSLLRGAFSFFSGILTAEAAEGVGLRLRDYLFDHIQHLSFTYHDHMKTGELIQRVTSDISSIQRFFSEQAIGIGRIVILFVVNVAALLALHWQLAIFSVLVVPLIAVMSMYFFRRVSVAWDLFQDQEGKLSSTLQENLTGVRVVKAFARQEYEINKFEKENSERFRLGVAFMRLHAVYWPLTDLITGFQMLFGFLAGGLLVINGQVALGDTVIMTGSLTLGEYIAYVGIIGWIINPMRNLGRLIVQVSTGLVSYDRLAEIMVEDWEDLGKTQTPPLNDLTGRVVFDRVSFEYEPDKPVLRDISFTVEPGQTVALLGSTGSGKTSLVALLTRFYDHTGGSITLDGVPLAQFPRHFLRRHIGIVEQEPFLFSRSLRENITYGVQREVSDEEVYAAARAAAAHDFIQKFPEAYGTIVGERGVTLSGGQKQRVVLARTLLKNPRILILDDATSSVDTETESQIRTALDTLMQRRTSFIIAHRIQSVMNADLILVLDKGAIVQRGTHAQLMQEDGIYRRTYDMQARIETELEMELSRVG
ncbi:MAG: ABC transporter ATP-binding protein/permease [Anaerolineae bacterium]|nr:ABC transporter ATP-binding protein/permease [Anaerolineae bacterium]